MKKSTGTNIGTNLILAAFGTAMLAPIHYDFESSNLPTEIKEYHKLNTNSWEGNIEFSSNTNNSSINSLLSFSENLLKNSSDIDVEIMELVNENYWDLI